MNETEMFDMQKTLKRNAWIPISLPIGNLFYQKYVLYLNDHAYIVLEGFRKDKSYKLTLFDAHSVRTTARNARIWTETITTKYRNDLDMARLTALKAVCEYAKPVRTWMDATAALEPGFWKELSDAAETAYAAEEAAYKDKKNHWIGV